MSAIQHTYKGEFRLPLVRIFRRVLDSQLHGDLLHFTMPPGNNGITLLVVLLDAFGDTVRLLAFAGGINGKTKVFREGEDGVERASVTAIYYEDRLDY